MAFQHQEQLILQVVDCAGTSKFTIVNLAECLTWSDFLVNVWNRTILSDTEFVCEAVSIALRSVNPSQKISGNEDFCLRSLGRGSDLGFLAYFSMRNILDPITHQFAPSANTSMKIRAGELIDEAFVRAEESTIWVDRKLDTFHMWEGLNFANIWEGSVRDKLAQALPRSPSAFVKHLIVKFHSAAGSVSTVAHNLSAKIIIDECRLMNWFELYAREQPRDQIGGTPLPYRVINGDTMALVMDSQTTDCWFNTQFFVENWLPLLAGMNRRTGDSQPERLRPSLEDWQSTLDFFFKQFFNSLRSKLVDRILDEAFEANWGHTEIVSRVSGLKSELSETFNDFRLSLRVFLAQKDGVSGPTAFMTFGGSHTDPLEWAEQGWYTGHVIPAFELKHFECWLTDFVIFHPLVHQHFLTLIDMVMSNVLEKAWSALKLKRALAENVNAAKVKQLGFHIETLASPR